MDLIKLRYLNDETIAEVIDLVRKNLLKYKQIMAPFNATPCCGAMVTTYLRTDLCKKMLGKDLSSYASESMKALKQHELAKKVYNASSSQLCRWQPRKNFNQSLKGGKSFKGKGNGSKSQGNAKKQEKK